MSIERRENQRTELVRPVILNADRIAPQFCQIRNISMTGLFVELAENNLKPDMDVSIVVTISSESEGSSGKIVRWPATVARVVDEGAGLALKDMDVDTMGSVLGMVYSN